MTTLPDTRCPGHDVDPALSDPLALTGAVTDSGSTRYYHITHCPDPAPPDHLVPTASDRGFVSLPTLAGRALTQVRVYESSLAFEGPHLWLNVREPADLNEAARAEATGCEYTGEWNDATIHFSSETALQLAEQLQHAVANHYQGAPE